ncbi:histidinol dehydrogenase [Polaromonas sp.]|uniref:histidinol dehydrogenase n=1 Tax=Polaromonas sp. TaxID=1869339 RepID=UPI00352A311D
MELRIFDLQTSDGRAAAENLRSLWHGGGITAQSGGVDVPKVVREILSAVQRGGDRSAAELTSKLDRANILPSNIRVSEEELARAHASMDKDFLALIRLSIESVRRYQEHIKVRQIPWLQGEDRQVGIRYTPIQRVGLYVPGGKALYPSSVLMTAVPAIVAGVPEIVMVSPPTGGDISPVALALAKELSITEVYRLGGAVGLAALAYGTETIRPVAKIAGPGNAFVAEAKRQLYGVVGVDSIAGPSEVVIVADDVADARFVAADMLSQAEHGPGSSILVTPSMPLALKVREEVSRQLEQLDRIELTSECIDRLCAVFVATDLAEACRVADTLAAEHLQIITQDDEYCLSNIQNAGAIFLGPWTPVAVGDYMAGPSHVLPTGGTARFAGPLSCNDFCKATSIIQYGRAALHSEGALIAQFAAKEGLDAHAQSVLKRIDNSSLNGPLDR